MFQLANTSILIGRLNKVSPPEIRSASRECKCFGQEYQFVQCTMYIIVKIGEHYWLEAVALHGALLL